MPGSLVFRHQARAYVSEQCGSLLLRNCDGVLPQPGIDILLSDHWNRLFGRRRRARANERFILCDNPGEHCHERQ